jgi:hypothetical protein
MSVAVHEPDHAHTGEDGAERREHDPEPLVSRPV